MKKAIMPLILAVLILAGCAERIEKIDYSLLEDEIFFQLDEIYKNPDLEKDIPDNNFDILLTKKRTDIFSKRYEVLQKQKNNVGVFYEEYYYNKNYTLFGKNYPMHSYELKAFVRLRESELGLAFYDNVIEAEVVEETSKDEETGYAEYRLETDDDFVLYMTTDDNTVFKDDSNYFYAGHIYFGGIPDPLGLKVKVHYDEETFYEEDNEKIIKALLIEQLSGRQE